MLPSSALHTIYLTLNTNPILDSKANVKISCTNPAKHAAEQTHILRRLIDTARQTWRWQTRQNMLPNISYTQTNSTYWHCEANVKISCTNTAKHAAGQHFIYSNNSTYWHCEANVKISYMHNHGKTCCRTTFHILKQLDLLTLRGKRKDIIHKHGKTCCRTTSHILKQLDLLTLRGKREDIRHKHGKTCCRTTSHKFEGKPCCP
jgi:hypothetical protein